MPRGIIDLVIADENGRTMTRYRAQFRSLGIAALLVIAIGLVIAGHTSNRALAKSVVWLNYNVTLELQDDSSFHVTEKQDVAFAGGPFSYAYATIPTTRMDDLRNVRVSEIRSGKTIVYNRSSSEDPETWTIDYSSNDVTITWFMPSTSNEVRTFVLEYDVVGGLRVYDSDAGTREQIWWTAIDDDVTEIAPINNATFTIVLPEPVDLATTVIDGPDGTDPADHTSDGQTWTWSKSNMSEGDSLAARLEFPAIVPASVPGWQEADDAKRQREEEQASRDALIKLLMAAAAALALTAGGSSLFGLWYLKGRDPGVGAVATYLSEPPDDLPPGAAGALVDEYADERDIVATMVDLGNRGVLKITQQPTGDQFGRVTYDIERAESDTQLRPFETTFVEALMGGGAKTDLAMAKLRFGPKSEKVKAQMYEELVARGYFPVSPETTRNRYRQAATIGIVVMIVLFGLVIGRLLGISYWVLVPILAISMLFLILRVVSKYMPKKSFSGAESAAKWRAFRKYLEDLNDDVKSDEAKTLFNKYLPYAVAFGIEQTWVNRFAAAGAPPPTWYTGSSNGGGTVWTSGGRRYRGVPGGGSTWMWGTGAGSSGSGGSGGSGGVDFPDLGDVQDLSGQGQKSLQGASSGLMGLFNLAGEAFEAFSSSSGGGRSGGFSGGGHSFGGGGSHGGGGGGGGGGSRGFG